jgi:hypothetical protein
MNVNLIAEDGYVSLGAEGAEKNLLVEDKRMVFKLQSQVSSPREIIHLQWQKILWVTLRDQVISPFLQGALWCVLDFGYFVAKRFLIIHDIGHLRVIICHHSLRDSGHRWEHTFVDFYRRRKEQGSLGFEVGRKISGFQVTGHPSYSR